MFQMFIARKIRNYYKVTIIVLLAFLVKHHLKARADFVNEDKKDFKNLIVVFKNT